MPLERQFRDKYTGRSPERICCPTLFDLFLSPLTFRDREEEAAADKEADATWGDKFSEIKLLVQKKDDRIKQQEKDKEREKEKKAEEREEDKLEEDKGEEDEDDDDDDDDVGKTAKGGKGAKFSPQTADKGKRKPTERVGHVILLCL